jgi:hypothetical protein
VPQQVKAFRKDNPMKTLKEQNFEKELPSGYKQAKYINAKNAKFGIILNAIAIVVLAIVMVFAFVILDFGGKLSPEIFDMEAPRFFVAYAVFMVSMIVYVVLHELVHGIAYKTLTGEKLTFGMSWSCAFCGVPNIFTYRRTALIAVLAPFTAFTVLLIPIIAWLYFISPVYYLITAFIFGLHLGGCSGDLYVSLLLMTKYKSPKTLMRDTGPEQYFYIPEEKI